MTLLSFLSRTPQLARYSSSPLGRRLSSASANKPVLTLFTKPPRGEQLEMQSTSQHQGYADLTSTVSWILPPALLVNGCNVCQAPVKWNFPSQPGLLKPCPLCDEAKEALEPYKGRFILQEVDITLSENSVWCDKYKYDIPVFHLNGKFLMKHRVDIQKFEDQLMKMELQNDENQ
ncbi:glutaredoxin-like protein C5orf63 homolog isoform X1 [Cuculus canorus]|uniref:glutaredoxin-like protein C5orf63 homolog isoform X1 n=1 Tax=Cuculus canorus TaxID=55661 RepID=UPI0023AAB02C|nr:glutaredoxin-like protein C5orf63 homolog isoform X1 [Cuculus canorus]XP_053911073.1 glutaredoxin-like protein C5orf63 homolog isoform X1 [Cuculus canorus]